MMDYTTNEFDKDAEEILIGTLLVHPGFVHEIDLDPRDFFIDKNRWIYRAALNLSKNGSFDLEDIISELERTEHFNKLGGFGHLTGLLNLNVGPGVAKGYISRIKRLSAKRKAIRFGSQLVKNIDRTDLDPERYRRELDRILDTSSKNGDLHEFIPKTTWTVNELYETDFPEPEYLIPDIVPFGLIIMAGRPKVGKSILALQIAVGAGSGGIVFDRQIERRKVLFYALEDGPRRINSRLKDLRAPIDADIELRLVIRPLVDGGLPEIEKAIESGFEMIVIDTFSRALGEADQLDSGQMNKVFGELHKLTIQNEICILIIDHHRKSSGFIPSPIDDVMGATAKAASGDAILGLYRSQGKKETTLQVRGREIEESEYALEFEKVTRCWQFLGEAGEIREDTVKGDVTRAIEELHNLGSLPSTTRIAEHLGQDKGLISRTLANLVKDGHVVRGDRQGREIPYYLAEMLVNHVNDVNDQD